MQNKLVIFPGLPGTGKSTLAERLARELRWPLLRIDDVVMDVPVNTDNDILGHPEEVHYHK